jgi:hypothetical protein
LKTLKSDTWTKLAEAYRDLFLIKNILFGLSNRYGKILYTFLITVAISNLRMLSDAIICRAKWNDLHILYKRDIIFNDD